MDYVAFIDKNGFNRIYEVNVDNKSFPNLVRAREYLIIFVASVLLTLLSI